MMGPKKGTTKGRSGGRSRGGGRGAHNNHGGRRGPNIEADFLPFSGTTLPRSPSHGRSARTHVLHPRSSKP